MTSETTKVVPLTCHGHSRPITHLSFSSHHSTTNTSQPSYYLISACKDNNPMLRDGLTGDWIGTFIGHKGAVWSARLSSCASLAATGSADFSAKIWDTFSGETTATLQHGHIVRAVAWPAYERPRTIATGGMEKKLRVWDLSRAQNGGANGVGNGSVNGNGNGNGVGGGEAESYKVGQGVHQGTIKSIIWSASDPNVLTTACDDKKIRWWDLRSSSPITEFEVEGLIGSCELNDGLDGNPDGTLSVAAGKSVYFFDGGRPGQLIKSIKTSQEVASVAVNGSARRFVTGSGSDTWVKVWDYDSEQVLETGKGHHGPVWTTSFSPDGKLYATGSEDGTIKLWKFTSGPYGLWR